MSLPRLSRRRFVNELFRFYYIIIEWAAPVCETFLDSSKRIPLAVFFKIILMSSIVKFLIVVSKPSMQPQS